MVGDLFIWAQWVDMMGLMHDMSYIWTTKCLPTKNDIHGFMNGFKKLNEDFMPSSWRFELEDKNLNTMSCCWTDHTSAHPYIEKHMDAKFSMKQSIFVC